MQPTPDKSSQASKKNKSMISDSLHPLERKYGREPKINSEDLWHWH
ncbi:MAG: hypothetical protein ACFFB5_23140 [Promethearchaeota archaeon]